MQNVYNDLLKSMDYNKFIVGDLLFIEYTCPLTDDAWSVWTQTDFIIHVLSGKKEIWNGSKKIMLTEGTTVYVKKGSFNMKQFFDEEWCMLGFFINDDFIRSVLKEIKGRYRVLTQENYENTSILTLNTNPVLKGFFQSIYPYFSQDSNPSNSLLELKLKELIVNILTNTDNESLAAYFQSIDILDRPSIPAVMNKNFYQSLSIREFAAISQRSLSTFKREFKSIFGMPPGKWLLGKRLEYAYSLIQNNTDNISQIAFESGFENPSHFSRAFKNKYGLSPKQLKSNLISSE